VFHSSEITATVPLLKVEQWPNLYHYPAPMASTNKRPRLLVKVREMECCL
jgi:hypothetical protein